MEDFLQDAPREELATTTVVECLTVTLGKTITNKLAVSSTTDTWFKTQIFVNVFPIEEYEYAALREKLLLLMESFKTNNLGTPYNLLQDCFLLIFIDFRRAL